MIKSVILKSVFGAKQNFVPGILPPVCCSDGVEIMPFRGGARASATISADFEIAWAFRGRSEEERLEKARRSRRNVPYILGILEGTAIPITWATVGHLFLERCQRGPAGLAHEDMLRPPKNARWDGDWYAHDPCTDWETDLHWYAPDLIQLIRSSRVNHEIGSHTFSHIDFLEHTSTRELVEQELRTCIQVMAPYGLQLRSLVYPFNNMGHQYLDSIGGLGLTAVRHRDKKIRLSYPERASSGVYKLYESMNLRQAKHYNYSEKVRIFLDEAVKRHAAYHIWFHPSDPTELFEHEFSVIIQEIAARRREGQLWVTTMADLAAYCEARTQTELGVRRCANGLMITLRSGYDAKRYGQTKLTLRILSDQLPISCSIQIQDRWEPVRWIHKGLHKAKRDAQSFLVDVPINARQLFVSFQPNHDSKKERSTAIASPAFG